MTNDNPTARCPNCGYLNPDDSRFCQKCRACLVRICRQCLAENSIQADYCKRCGTKISEAKLGLTKEVAEKWWNHFCQYSGYTTLWTQQGYARSIYATSVKLEDTIEPSRPQMGHLAFSLPIASRDWCIRLLQWQTEQVVFGSFSTYTTGLTICDLERKSIRRMFYDEIKEVAIGDDSVNLQLTSGDTLTLHIRVPRPSKTIAVLDAGFTLLAALSAKSYSDSSVMSDDMGERMESRVKRTKEANSYVESVAAFFSALLERKKKIEELETG